MVKGTRMLYRKSIDDPKLECVFISSRIVDGKEIFTAVTIDSGML